MKRKPSFNKSIIIKKRKKYFMSKTDDLTD